MNKKFVAISIDSLLKTFSAVDAGENVSFQITSEERPTLSVDDCVLGFVGHGVDEFRIAFVLTLKIGDYLFTGTPSGVGPVSIGQHLQGYIGEEKLLDFYIR